MGAGGQRLGRAGRQTLHVVGKPNFATPVALCGVVHLVIISSHAVPMTMVDALLSMDLLEGAIERADPEQQKQWLLSVGFDPPRKNGGTSEWAHLAWHTRVKQLSVRRYQHTGILMVDPEEAAADTGFGFRVPKKLPVLMLVRSPHEEYRYLQLRANFTGHPKVFEQGSLVKARGNAVYLLERGKKRLFPSGQVFLRMGFNFEDVLTIPAEQLEAIPTGDVLS